MLHTTPLSLPHLPLVIRVGDRPLVVQFAARNGKEFADAAELVAPFADAVDLNCGCPQRCKLARDQYLLALDRRNLRTDVGIDHQQELACLLHTASHYSSVV